MSRVLTIKVGQSCTSRLLPKISVLALIAVTLFAAILHSVPSQSTESSPFRAFYPDVKTISTGELFDVFFEVTLIDVRSSFEFDVVNIASSVNLPLANDQFRNGIINFHKLDVDIDLVLIGSDSDCLRTFEAARIAQRQGIENVYVYDAGVQSWLYMYPDRTRLMGDRPAKIEDVLPLIKHQIHLVSYQSFSKAIENPAALILDIRNIYDKRHSLDLPMVKEITLDSLMDAIGNRVWSEKELFIFDSNGSTTRWLQLFLQAAGYHNFYFLVGGIDTLQKKHLKEITNNTQGQIVVNQVKLKSVVAENWQHNHAAGLLGYIISAIRFDNFAFIDAEDATSSLGISFEQFRELAAGVAKTGHFRVLEMNGDFVFQIDPQIAWKGEMEGYHWQKAEKQYHINSRR